MTDRNMFNLTGKNAVILGGSGVLGTALAGGLAGAGANVVICGRNEEKAEKLARTLGDTYRVKSAGFAIDAMNLESLQETCAKIMGEFEKVDILINGVGGGMKEATTSDSLSFFDITQEAFEKVVGLNLFGGAVYPCQVFGREMAASADGGVIINISSMNYYRPLTRTPGYSAAKAAVSNFTQWLAVHMAQNYGEKIRVNAIAPGFFLTDQNRFLLTDAQTGELTRRGRQIIEHTPMGRFGNPDDLISTVIWLACDASRFVTGITVPVDGGFSSYSGV